MARSIVFEKAEEFAVRIVKLYQYLTTLTNKKEFVMSKQLLRSGTSIGANLAESEYAISDDDFIAKLYISLKECNESRFWLRLLYRCEFLTKEEFQSLYGDCEEILKMLVAITKSMKVKKQKSKKITSN